jgi:transmembrane sensor
MTRKTAQEIDMEAANWLLRIDAGELSQSHEQALEAWLGGDPRCPGALARMQAIAVASERALALGIEHDPADIAPNFTRRRVWQVTAGVAATLAVGTISGWQWLRVKDRYRTGKGESKVLALQDGSVVTLNTASEIKVDFSGSERSVELVRGEALFDVTKNPSRAFVVAAGDANVRVVGTSFTVKKFDAAPVQVLVKEGVVEVSRPAIPEVKSVKISANMRAIVPSDQGVIATHAVPSAELHREMVWRDGQIEFEGQTLNEAVAEFARYSDIRVVIDDPSLAHEEIAGLFQANDPIRFAHIIAVSLKAHAHVKLGEVHLYR